MSSAGTNPWSTRARRACPFCGAPAIRTRRNVWDRFMTAFNGKVKWECDSYHIFFAPDRSRPDSNEAKEEDEAK